MESISYTTARIKLAKTMDRVCEDHAPIAITRKGESAVVMMSMEDYQALEETAYLLRSPENMRRLLGPSRSSKAAAARSASWPTETRP